MVYGQLVQGHLTNPLIRDDLRPDQVRNAIYIALELKRSGQCTLLDGIEY